MSGITTAIYTPSGGSIPANLAKPVIDQLREHGKVTRGWLGVQLQEVTPAIAKSFGLPKAEGALITEVIDRGPGAKAGFRQGDVILSYSGRSIETLRDLPLLVAETPPGQQASVTVWRKGREATLSPTIEEMPEFGFAALSDRDSKGEQRVEQTSIVLGLRSRRSRRNRAGFSIFRRSSRARWCSPSRATARSPISTSPAETSS